MGEAKRKKRGMSRQRNRGSVLQAMVPTQTWDSVANISFI
jgi:hypothetical protein